MALQVSDRADVGDRPPAEVRVLSIPEDDEGFLAALRAGTPAAAALLFDRFALDVNRLVRRLMGNDPDQDDVVQQVFLAALRGVHRLREAGALRAWVVSVTVNTVRSEIRRRRYRRLVEPDTAVAESAVTVEDDPEGRELSRHLYAALDKISSDERIPLALRYIEGMELTEVAAACGCSLATIKRRLSRAQARLMKIAQRDPVLTAALGKEGAGDA